MKARDDAIRYTYAFVDASPKVQILPGTVRLSRLVVLNSFNARLIPDPILVQEKRNIRKSMVLSTQ
jgi:hypothetical protein